MISLPPSLYQSVIGGPPFPPEELDLTVARIGVPLPLLVYAESVWEARTLETVQAEGAAVRTKRAGRLVELRPVGMFRLVPAQGAAPAMPHRLTAPERLVYALQQAILQQRQRELISLSGERSDSFTAEQEQEAFSLAIQEVWRDGAGRAVEVWSRIVIHRHQMQINAIRLRWLEFLTALTRGSEANLAFATFALVQEIYREYSLTRLALLPQRIAGELLPLLIARSGERHPVMDKAFAVMEARFAEGIALAEVASACHISAAHLARVFRKQTGQTVVAHLQRLRVNRACELLATTTLPLLEVSMASGFESVEHFHRLFRRQCGMTPRTYRHLRQVNAPLPDQIRKGGA